MAAKGMAHCADACMIHPPATTGACRSISANWSSIAFISSTRSRQKNGAPDEFAGRPPTRELAWVGWITTNPLSAQN